MIIYSRTSVHNFMKWFNILKCLERIFFFFFRNSCSLQFGIKSYNFDCGIYFVFLTIFIEKFKHKLHGTEKKNHQNILFIYFLEKKNHMIYDWLTNFRYFDSLELNYPWIMNLWTARNRLSINAKWNGTGLAWWWFNGFYSFLNILLKEIFFFLL